LVPVPEPAALPDVVPAVEDPVAAPPVAAPPAALPPAAPPLDCASAKLLVKTSAAVNPKVASFMIVPLLLLLLPGPTIGVAIAFLAADHSSLLFRRGFHRLDPDRSSYLTPRVPTFCSTKEIWLA